MFFRANLIKSQALVVISLVVLNLQGCDSAVSVFLDQTSYTIMSGDSLKITCKGANLNVEDVVWQYYPIGNISELSVIYLQQEMKSGNKKFHVNAAQLDQYSIITTLTIKDLNVADGAYRYQCVCNIYTACASGNKAAATADLTILTTTTTSTTTTTTRIPPLKIEVCPMSSAYNTAQYALLLFANCLLVVSVLLFHYSFHGSLVETFFLASVIITSLFCLITSVIFWINPNIFNLIDGIKFSPLIIISCSLLSIAILWLLVLQYAIRLGINNDIKLIVIVLVCVDAILEFGAALTLLVANLYCTEVIYLPIMFGFSYTYLQVIGAVFLVVFDLLLLLIAAVIFFIRKKKKNMFIFNNLKILTNGLVTPFGHYPGVFVPRSDSIEPETDQQAKIQELWFNNSSKMNSLEREHTFAKSRKLTPLNSLSRRQSEMINQLEQRLDITKLPTESIFNKILEKRPNDNQINQDIEHTYTENVMVSGKFSPPCLDYVNEKEAILKPSVVVEETVKVKPKKVKKKKKDKAAKKEKLPAVETVNLKAEAKIDEIFDLTEENKDKIVRISKFASTEEMPANTIDSIWDVNRLNLLLEDATQCLGSIKEDLPNTRSEGIRKSSLGATRFKPKDPFKDTNKSTTKDTEFKFTDTTSTTDFNDSSSKDLTSRTATKNSTTAITSSYSSESKKKYDDKIPATKPRTPKADDSINLVDESDTQNTSNNTTSNILAMLS